jgi:hypothetical protein
LLQCPARCRMGCNVVMHDPACPHFHDHEYVKDAERGCAWLGRGHLVVDLIRSLPCYFINVSVFYPTPEHRNG